MPYSFTADGWQDWNGGRYDGEPPEVLDTQGIFVHAVNDDDVEDEHFFWTFVGEPFEDWDEWLVLIGAMMDMHGMSIA